MKCASHWYMLGTPVNGRVPGKCRDCDAERDWPDIGTQAEGRPWIIHDPLLRRTMVGGYGLPQFYK